MPDQVRHDESGTFYGNVNLDFDTLSNSYHGSPAREMLRILNLAWYEIHYHSVYGSMKCRRRSYTKGFCGFTNRSRLKNNSMLESRMKPPNWWSFPCICFNIWGAGTWFHIVLCGTGFEILLFPGYASQRRPLKGLIQNFPLTLSRTILDEISVF